MSPATYSTTEAFNKLKNKHSHNVAGVLFNAKSAKCVHSKIKILVSLHVLVRSLKLKFNQRKVPENITVHTNRKTRVITSRCPLETSTLRQTSQDQDRTQ